ncbi:hypothetical protein ATANTOWER_008383, partial [Ataeniobius toweri]|nr:hypothetical protein [Ataeniobius toweri]
MYPASCLYTAGHRHQLPCDPLRKKQHCVCFVAMQELVTELRLFLDLLDREYLSAGVREKKVHLSNILHRVLSDKEPRSEIHSGLPAPPQMPLPEIPHPWLVSLTFFIFDFFSH